MTTRGSGATRGGGDGLRNEDAFVVDDGLGLYVVCDGESTRPAGEVAARIAAESVARVIAQHRGPGREADALDEGVVEEALRSAVSAVARAGAENDELAGLSTTVSLAVVHGHHAVVGHRGDSCVYLIRNGHASRLTGRHAHTTERPAEPTPGDDGPEFEVFSTEVDPGDTLVLCSDGAAAALDDPTLHRAAGQLSPPILASRIVSAANRIAPDQDATAVIVRLLPTRTAGWLSISGRPSPTRFGHLVHGWSEPADDGDDGRERRELTARDGD